MIIWLHLQGMEISPDEQPAVIQALEKNHSCVPVFLDSETAEMHYNGFSNRYIPSLTSYLSNHTLIIKHPMAAIPLPPRWDKLRRGILGSVSTCKHVFRRYDLQNRTCWGYHLDPRLSSSPPPIAITTTCQLPHQDWILFTYAVSE